VKRYFRYFNLMAFVILMFTGPVSATGTGITVGNIDAVNATITPYISPTMSLQTDISGAIIGKQLPAQVQQNIDNQVAFREKITTAIREKEEQLELTPLEIHDNHDITGQASGFNVGDDTSSTVPVSPGIRRSPVRRNHLGNSHR
jgi:hypothetical protein